MPPRDTQRSRAYAWDSAMKFEVSRMPMTRPIRVTLPGLVAPVMSKRGTTAASWESMAVDDMRTLAADAYALYAPNAVLRFKWRTARARRSCGGQGGIRMMKRCRSGHSIIHEVAHAIHWHPSRWRTEAGHGPEWARVMVELMTEFSPLGRFRIERLAAECGVRVTPRADMTLRPVGERTFR